MGKLKRNRKNQKARVNPLKRSGDEHKQDQKDENTRQSKILPLINKLRSSVPNDRSMALGVITVLCEDQRMRKLLLKEKLVNIILEQCLSDSSDEIVVESFGLLRNLGIEEGYDITKYLWRSDIWTPIEKALSKIESSFKYLEESSNQDKKKEDKSKMQLLFDFAENVLSLIVVIASGSEDLYDEVLLRIDTALSLVINLLNWNMPSLKVTLKLLNSLFDFIYELSTQSVEFIKKLENNNGFNLERLIEFVKSPAQDGNKLGKIYVEGIKFNILEALDKIENKDAVCSDILINIFDISTSIDLNKLKKELTPPDNSTEPIAKENENEEVFDSSKKNQSQADINCLEISLDLISSILEYLSLNDQQIENPVSLSSPLVTILIDKIYCMLYELLKFEISSQNMLSLVEKILIALNNMLWLFLSSTSIPVEWYEKILDLWNVIIELTTHEDIILQKNCLNILWAISKSLGPEIQTKININIDTLISKCEIIIEKEVDEDIETDNLEFLLSTVGFLGSLAPNVANTQMTHTISEFLLRCIEIFSQKHKNSLYNRIVIECLNLIYDIFGDKEYLYDYEVFVKQNYLDRLSSLEMLVKEMYKKIDKNKNEGLKLEAEEAWVNLGRFIEYKKSEQ